MAAGRAEFQAVVMATQSESVLHPLSLGLPPSLLPVANHPLILYQLALLRQAHFTHAIVVTCGDFREQLQHYLGTSTFQSVIRGLSIDVVNLPDEMGTADVLRHLRERIVSDFVVISGDLVTESSVHNLADVFRMRDASVAMLFKELAPPRDKDERKKRIKAQMGVVDYVGLVHDGPRTEQARVVALQSCSREDPFELPKQLLREQPQITLRTDIVDAEMYIFRHWVLELLEEKRHVESIRDDLLPYLVKLQHRGIGVLSERMARATELPLAAAHEMVATGPNVSGAPPTNEDRFRCYALVLPASGAYCQRASSLAAYASINRDVATMGVAASTPWPKVESHTPHKFAGSVLGKSCEVGEKVTIKNCIVGNHVKIGNKTKLNNCVVMDHAVLGEECIVQNTVLCSHAVIGNRSNVNDCQLADKVVVAEGSRLKGETLIDSFS